MRRRRRIPRRRARGIDDTDEALGPPNKDALMAELARRGIVRATDPETVQDEHVREKGHEPEQMERAIAEATREVKAKRRARKK
jgi:hypothetical protein